MSIRLCFYFPQSRAIIKHLCAGVENINMDAFLLMIISHTTQICKQVLLLKTGISICAAERPLLENLTKIC